jgi:hypothetical protein
MRSSDLSVLPQLYLDLSSELNMKNALYPSQQKSNTCKKCDKNCKFSLNLSEIEDSEVVWDRTSFVVSSAEVWGMKVQCSLNFF